MSKKHIQYTVKDHSVSIRLNQLADGSKWTYSLEIELADGTVLPARPNDDQSFSTADEAQQVARREAESLYNS
jgi:hypothetical protein